MKRALVAGLVALAFCGPRSPTRRLRAPDAGACQPAPSCPGLHADDPRALESLPQWARLRALLEGPEEAIDVAEVSLLVSQVRDPTVDLPGTLRRLDELALEVRQALPPRCAGGCALEALTRHIYDVWRFAVADDPNGLFNDPDNDLIDRVVARRRGYCEGLTILYLALGRRLGIPLAAMRGRQHVYLRYLGEGGPMDLETTDRGRPFRPLPEYGDCRAAEGVFGAPLGPREAAGMVVSVLGIMDGVVAKRAWLDVALRWGPRDPDLWNNRGVERHRALDFDGALSDYRRASEVDPCASLYRTNAAWVLADLGRRTEALALLDAVDAAHARGALDPDPIFPSEVRAQLALDADDDAEAERWVQRALQDSNRAPAARFAASEVRLSQGRFEDAQLEALAALELDPRADNRLLLVEALLRGGRARDAETELQRAARDHGPPEELVLWRAAVAEALGRHGEAHALAAECLERHGRRCMRALVVLSDAARARGDLVCARRYRDAFSRCDVPRDRYLRTLDAELRQRLP